MNPSSAPLDTVPGAHADTDTNARQLVRAHDWPAAEALVEQGHVGLHDLIEQVRIYQTELELQAHELSASRRKIERGLRRFLGLFTALPTAVLLLDRHALVIEANQAAESLLGQHMLRLHSHSALRLPSNQADRVRLQAALVRARTVGRAHEPSMAVGDSDLGVIADVHVRFLPPDDDNEAQYIVVFVDQSEVVRGARALAKSEQLRREQAETNRVLATVAARTHSMVLIADASGYTTWVNESFTRTTGYTLLEASGQKPGQLLQGPGTDPETVRRMSAALLSGQGFEGVEVLNYAKDGRPYWAELDVQPQRRADGTVECFIAVGQDITARKESEHQLRQRDYFQQAVFDNDPSAILVLDSQGRVQSMNRAALALAALPDSAQAVGQTADSVLNPRLPETLVNTVRAALTGLSDKLEIERVVGGATPRWLEIHAAPLWQSGFIGGALLVARDITEVRALESVQREKLAAELANQAKTQFVSRMSHELRTPLNAIIGFSHLARRGRPSPEAGVLDRQLGLIEEAGQHLLRMINEVLQFSAIESGHVPIALGEVAIGDSIDFATGVLEPLKARTGQQLDVAGDRGAAVRADPMRLNEVLSNLLSNALKYNRPGGRVSVRIARQNARVRVSIADEGPGLTPAQRERLFEPFNRLGAERRGIEGSGMGLVITRSLLHAMAGSIDVESQPGAGSVFSFELPAAESASRTTPEASASAALPTAPTAPMTALPSTDTGEALALLYVEDSPVNVLLLQETLAHWRPHWRLDVCSDGIRGVDAARARPYHAILLDISLPDMSGLDVLRLIKAEGANVHTPCIALSANVMVEDQAKALAAGFLHYQTKPFEVDDLLQCIEQACRTDAASTL